MGQKDSEEKKKYQFEWTECVFDSGEIIKGVKGRVWWGFVRFFEKRIEGFERKNFHNFFEY